MTFPHQSRSEESSDRLRDIIIAILFLIIGVLLTLILSQPLPETATNYAMVSLLLVVVSLAFVIYSYGKKSLSEYLQRRQLDQLAKANSSKLMEIIRRFHEMINPDRSDSLSARLRDIRSRISELAGVQEMHPYDVQIPTGVLQQLHTAQSFANFATVFGIFSYMVKTYNGQHAKPLIENIGRLKAKGNLPEGVSQYVKEYNKTVRTYNNLIDEINALDDSVSKELGDRKYNNQIRLATMHLDKLDEL